MSPKVPRSRVFRALAVTATAAALTSGGFIAVAFTASAADDPLPWIATETSNGERVGGLSFYNGTTQIYSGHLSDAPTAEYIVTDGGVPAGDSWSAGATAYVYTPNTSDPATWTNNQWSTTAQLTADNSATNAAYTDLPPSIQSSQREVVPLSLSVNDGIAGMADSYPAPNDHVYEIRVLGDDASIWYSADIEIDTAANTWTQVFPAQVVGTSITSITASPVTPAPAGTTSVALSATLTAADSSTPVGAVELFDGATDLGAATLTSGAIAATATGLTDGSSHSYQFKFIGATGYGNSDSLALSYSIASPPPPPPPPAPHATALTIAKKATIAYGKTVTISGAIKDITIGQALAGARVSLYARPTGARTFVKVKDVMSSSTGAVLATGVKPVKTTVYQWMYAATAAYQAASSGTVTITVTRTASISKTPSTFKHGKSAKVFGVVKPVAGGKATLQKLVGRRWVSVGSVTIKRQKLPNKVTTVGYVIIFKSSARGTFSLRIVTSPVTGYAPGTSATMRIKVS